MGWWLSDLSYREVSGLAKHLIKSGFRVVFRIYLYFQRVR